MCANFWALFSYPKHAVKKVEFYTLQGQPVHSTHCYAKIMLRVAHVACCKAGEEVGVLRLLAHLEVKCKTALENG